VPEHPFDHGLFHDREHLLRCRERQGPEPGALAAHQDDGPHPFVPPGFVVVAVDEVVAVTVVVEVTVGTEVDDTEGTVVDVGPASSAVIRSVMTEAAGFGTVPLAGMNAMVISCPFWNSRF